MWTVESWAKNEMTTYHVPWTSTAATDREAINGSFNSRLPSRDRGRNDSRWLYWTMGVFLCFFFLHGLWDPNAHKSVETPSSSTSEHGRQQHPQMAATARQPSPSNVGRLPQEESGGLCSAVTPSISWRAISFFLISSLIPHCARPTSLCLCRLDASFQLAKLFWKESFLGWK